MYLICNTIVLLSKTFELFQKLLPLFSNADLYLSLQLVQNSTFILQTIDDRETLKLLNLSIKIIYRIFYNTHFLLFYEYF